MANALLRSYLFRVRAASAPADSEAVLLTAFPYTLPTYPECIGLHWHVYFFHRCSMKLQFWVLWWRSCRVCQGVDSAPALASLCLPVGPP